LNREKRAAVLEELANELTIEGTDAKKLKQFWGNILTRYGKLAKKSLVTNGSLTRSPLFILTLPGSLMSLVLSDRRAK
jgi:hypothetical protein